MMDMHSFLNAKQIEISSSNDEENLSAKGLFEFLYQISQWLQTVPLVYRNGFAETNTVYMWFDDVAFAEEDFWQMFGEYLVLFRTKWKIDIFGTSDSSQETVWLTLKEDNDHIYAVQKTLSGNPVDTIESLCMRIQCTSLQQSEVLFALFTATNWKNGTTVVDWKYGSFLLEENFAIPTKNSCFCYGSVFDDVKHEEVLQALNFQQKIVLWTAFLKNGFDYEEFEWLYNAIAENVVPNRIEWELSLHTAMQNLGYIIQVLPNDFELYDGNGCRRYFSFNSASYAERTFLKILFPLNM